MENLPEKIYMESSVPDGDGYVGTFHTDIKKGGYEYVSPVLYDDMYEKYQDAEIARLQLELKLVEITNLVKSFDPLRGKKDG